MPPSEARLYFVMTMKGDLGPFSKQELREQLREHAFAATDRVRNAFGRPLGSVSEVLGNASQTIQAPQPSAAPVQRRPAKRGPPWPIIGVAGGILLILLLLWLSRGGDSQPEVPEQDTRQPPAPAVQPVQTAQPAIRPAPVPAPSPAPNPAAQAVSDGMPAGYSFIDLGDSRPKGSVAGNDRGVLVITGGGSDVWGGRDECAYMHRPFTGDGMITVELRTMQDTDAWDKSGIMLRASTAADAPHVSILAIHNGTIQFIQRHGQGHESVASEFRLPSFPIWLRLERRGDRLIGSASPDGVAWSAVGSVELPAVAGASVAGLAVCSHNRSTTNRTVFAGLSVTQDR